MGTWSDPVEGMVEASQDRKAGWMRGLAKPRSMALGLKVPRGGLWCRYLAGLGGSRPSRWPDRNRVWRLFLRSR